MGDAMRSTGLLVIVCASWFSVGPLVELATPGTGEEIAGVGENERGRDIRGSILFAASGEVCDCTAGRVAVDFDSSRRRTVSDCVSFIAAATKSETESTGISGGARSDSRTINHMACRVEGRHGRHRHTSSTATTSGTAASAFRHKTSIER
jgi:hypothetical protein